MLGRVGGPTFPRRSPEWRRDLFEEVRRLSLERFGDEVEAHLAFHHRLRSRILRDGNLELLEALAQYEARLRAKATLREVDRQLAALRLEVEAEIRIRGKGGPLTFARDGERVRWLPPPKLRE